MSNDFKQALSEGCGGGAGAHTLQRASGAVMRTVWNGGLALAGQMATKNAVPSTTEVNGTARKLCENILDGAAWAALLRGFETRQFGKITKISGPRIFTSEGRQDVEITGFEGI